MVTACKWPLMQYDIVSETVAGSTNDSLIQIAQCILSIAIENGYFITKLNTRANLT